MRKGSKIGARKPSQQRSASVVSPLLQSFTTFCRIPCLMTRKQGYVTRTPSRISVYDLKDGQRVQSVGLTVQRRFRRLGSKNIGRAVLQLTLACPKITLTERSGYLAILFPVISLRRIHLVDRHPFNLLRYRRVDLYSKPCRCCPNRSDSKSGFRQHG